MSGQKERERQAEYERERERERVGKREGQENLLAYQLKVAIGSATS